MSEPQIGRVTRTGTYCTEGGVESGTVVSGSSLLEHLQDAGYEQQETLTGYDRYELTAPGGKIRLDVDDDSHVYRLDRAECLVWAVNIAGRASDVLLAVLQAAETELAGQPQKTGGA